MYEHELLAGLKFVLFTLIYTASVAILNYSSGFSVFNVFLYN